MSFFRVFRVFRGPIRILNEGFRASRLCGFALKFLFPAGFVSAVRFPGFLKIRHRRQEPAGILVLGISIQLIRLG